MYKQLGCKIKNSFDTYRKNFKTGLALYSFFLIENQSFTIPYCLSIQISCKDQIVLEEVQKNLKNYSILAENQKIPIFYNEISHIIHIEKLLPKPICMISENFTVSIHEKDSKTSKLEFIKNLGLEILPKWPEKYPKFLMEIMTRNTPKKSDWKNRSKTPQSPIILFNEAYSIPAEKKFKLPKRIYSEFKKKTPDVFISKNKFHNSPKIVNFNLPMISLHHKKIQKFSYKQPIRLEK